MSQEEHYLRVLVEGDLSKRIRAIKEGNFPNEKEMIENAIISFEENLPDWAKKIPNYHSIILDTLKREEDEMAKIKQMRQEEKSKKDDGNER